MSLEVFLANGDTFLIAEAYQLLELAKLVKNKYEEAQKEVAKLVEKYGVTDDELFGASCDLDAWMLDDEELMERADKLVAHEKGWSCVD